MIFFFLLFLSSTLFLFGLSLAFSNFFSFVFVVLLVLAMLLVFTTLGICHALGVHNSW